MSLVAGGPWLFSPLLVYTLKRLRFSKVVSMRPGERPGILRKCLQTKGLRHLLKLFDPIPAVPAGFSQIHHKERLPSPVVNVKHPRFGFLGYHHEQESSLRIVHPLLELPLCPPRKSQDQCILIQPVQAETLCVWAMHAQHFVDNQTIHHGHRNSPFILRSQVVYRHTVPPRCVNAPRPSASAVCLCGVTTESSERRTAPSRKASASIPARIYIRIGSQAARSLALPPAATALADSFARTSQRSWSRSDPWPRTQCHFVSCWPATDANSSHKSRFAMAS